MTVDFDFLRGRDDLARMHVLLGPAHLRDVDQALDAGFQLDEGAIFGDVGHAALEHAADRIFSRRHPPTDRSSSCFMPRLMRWVSRLMRMICTFTVSPMLITSLGWLTRL